LIRIGTFSGRHLPIVTWPSMSAPRIINGMSLKGIGRLESPFPNSSIGGGTSLT
jgi:hypothetical protein